MVVAERRLQVSRTFKRKLLHVLTLEAQQVARSAGGADHAWPLSCHISYCKKTQYILVKPNAFIGPKPHYEKCCLFSSQKFLFHSLRLKNKEHQSCR